MVAQAYCSQLGRYFHDPIFDALQIIQEAGRKHGLTMIEIGYRWVVHHSALNTPRKGQEGNDGRSSSSGDRLPDYRLERRFVTWPFSLEPPATSKCRRTWHTWRRCLCRTTLWMVARGLGLESLVCHLSITVANTSTPTTRSTPSTDRTLCRESGRLGCDL
jgi:hypothetical protein